MKAIAALLILAGCAVPTQVTTQLAGNDLTGAHKVATAGSDTAGSACWTFLNGILTALPPQMGIATLVELTAIIRSPPFAAACGTTIQQTAPLATVP